jgi:hypothetical protein
MRCRGGLVQRRPRKGRAGPRGRQKAKEGATAAERAFERPPQKGPSRGRRGLFRTRREAFSGPTTPGCRGAAAACPYRAPASSRPGGPVEVLALARRGPTRPPSAEARPPQTSRVLRGRRRLGEAVEGPWRLPGRLWARTAQTVERPLRTVKGRLGRRAEGPPLAGPPLGRFPTVIGARCRPLASTAPQAAWPEGPCLVVLSGPASSPRRGLGLSAPLRRWRAPLVRRTRRRA